jgi:putative transcriptional regulator
MTIQHHPSESLIEALAAGTLDQGQHIAVATHLVRCSDCRAWARSMEYVGGAVLAALPPAAMSSGALDRIEGRLHEPPPPAQAIAPPPSGLADVPGLPAFVRRLPASQWTWIAPCLYLRRVVLPETDATRVFLLKSNPGTRLIPHAHTGIEMTCVLTGSFSHDGRRYGPGDFDLGEPGVDHEIAIGPEGDCISLVAMQGELRLKGILGHLVQPLISL